MPLEERFGDRHRRIPCGSESYRTGELSSAGTGLAAIAITMIMLAPTRRSMT